MLLASFLETAVSGVKKEDITEELLRSASYNYSFNVQYVKSELLQGFQQISWKLRQWQYLPSSALHSCATFEKQRSWSPLSYYLRSYLAFYAEEQMFQGVLCLY